MQLEVFRINLGFIHYLIMTIGMVPFSWDLKSKPIHQCFFCCLVHRVIVTIFLSNWYLKQLLRHLLVQAVNDIIALTVIRKLQKNGRAWYCLACRLQGKLGIDCVFIILLGSYIFLISHSCTERPMWQCAILDSTWQCVCMCVYVYF